MQLVCMNPEHVKQLRICIQKKEGIWEDVAWELNRWAQAAMKKGPWSITNGSRLAPSGNLHDYFTEAPYFWPDPENPKGPYIRRDGQVNPNRFNEHRNWLSELAQTITALTLGGYYLDEKCFLDRAAELLQVWFLDEATRMNPNWNYGQAIPGICDGRPIGIIEMLDIDKIVYGMNFLGADSRYAPILEGMQKWISELLNWMLIPGGFGEQEWLHGNNHSVWCIAHIAMYAAFTNQPEVISKCVQIYQEKLIEQIAADGSLPKELERTRSFHYSFFALNAFAIICEAVRPYGFDLWHCQNSVGGSLQRAAEFLLPAMKNPFTWKYLQIDDDIPQDSYFFQMAAQRLNLPQCSTANQLRREGYRLIRMQEPFGPLCLQDGEFQIGKYW